MSTTNPNGSDVMGSIPNPMPSGGMFAPVTDPSANAFSDPNSTTYSALLMNPAAIIGTADAPYMPMAQAAYTSTLYQNVFNINNNLENNISTAAADNRKYPTSYAVQAYVQSQISGSQLIGNSNNVYIVNTTVVNTIVQEEPTIATYGQYTDNNGNTSGVAQFQMDDSANATRVGATKQVVFQCDAWLNAVNTDDEPLVNLIYLYAGPNSYFLVDGVQQKYYQVTHYGDYLSFVMLTNPATATAPAGWVFLVTGYQSLFTNVLSSSITLNTAYGGYVAPA